MPSIYCGVEDFQVLQTGDAMADAIRRAAADVDPSLAERLVLDAESGGLEIAMPTAEQLMIVLDIAVHRGLIASSFVADLEVDELRDLRAEEPAGLRDGFVGPMNIEGVTEDGVIGAFNTASFPRGASPAETISGLLDHARRAIESEPWAEHVTLTATNEHVLVEAPDVLTLDRAAKAVGTLGLPTFADDLVRVMRTESEHEEARRASRDWVVRRGTSPGSRWVALGSVSDVTAVYVEGDPVRATTIILDHLDATGVSSAERLDVTVEPDWTVQVLGDAEEDVRWAADELRRSHA